MHATTEYKIPLVRLVDLADAVMFERIDSLVDILLVRVVIEHKRLEQFAGISTNTREKDSSFDVTAFTDEFRSDEIVIPLAFKTFLLGR